MKIVRMLTRTPPSSSRGDLVAVGNADQPVEPVGCTTVSGIGDHAAGSEWRDVAHRDPVVHADVELRNAPLRTASPQLPEFL